MPLHQEIRDAVIAKAKSADEATLISMLEAAAPLQQAAYAPFDETEAAMLNERLARYERGESKGSTLEEIIGRIQARRNNGTL